MNRPLYGRSGLKRFQGTSPRFEQLCDRKEKFPATGIVVTRKLECEGERTGKGKSLRIQSQFFVESVGGQDLNRMTIRIVVQPTLYSITI